MSDSWTSSSPPPVAHLSSLSHPLPPLSNHGNPPPAKVSSPFLCPPHLASPDHLSQTQISSFQFSHSQVSSPLLTHSQVSSPLLTHSQVSSPHLPHPQVISPHFSYPQVTSPHFAPQASPSHPFYQNQIPPQHFPSSQMNSPHHLASPQMSSPLLPHPHDPSPHLLPPPQHFSFSQSADPELDYSDWDRCESSEQSCFLSFSCQSQPTAHLNPQTQRPFGLGQTLPGDPSQTSYRPQVFEQGDTPGQNHYTWGGGVPLPSLAQQQCSPLGSTSAEGPLRGWSSLDFASLSAEDFPTGQLFHENYQASQPFCSPTTPGPSPHPPQTPAVSSPGPQVYLRSDGIGSQTLLNPLDCSLNQFESHLLAPDPGRPPPHQTQEDLGGQLQAARGSEAEGGPRRDILPDLSWIQVKRMQPESSTELLGSRLLCTVCKRDFRSLPALNGHMRSHSGFRSPTMLKKALSPPGPNSVSMVMPVSVPVQTRRVSPAHGGGQNPQTPRRRALYQSLMHEHGGGDGGHYTPPPMLCPQRGGPGLYCSLTPARPHGEPGDPVAMATAPASGPVPPRINLGRRFQAEVPPLRARNAAHAISHNATLLWTPWEKLEGPAGQQRVEALLMMAKSSVLLGGGSSPEYVLQVLSESRGDFLKTVEKLLTAPKPSSLRRTGVSWSPGEKRLLLKSLQLHHKDFSSIQRAVKTKSLSECVEFYYLWKKKLSLGVRTPVGLTVTLPDSNGQRLWKHQKAS